MVIICDGEDIETVYIESLYYERIDLVLCCDLSFSIDISLSVYVSPVSPVRCLVSGFSEGSVYKRAVSNFTLLDIKVEVSGDDGVVIVLHLVDDGIVFRFLKVSVKIAVDRCYADELSVYLDFCQSVVAVLLCSTSGSICIGEFPTVLQRVL